MRLHFGLARAPITCLKPGQDERWLIPKKKKRQYISTRSSQVLESESNGKSELNELKFKRENGGRR